MMDPSTNTIASDKWWMVVVMAKFVMELLQQGLLKSLGVLLPSFVVYFQTDYGTMGALLSLEYSTYYLATPLARMLSKRVNPRLMSTLGGAGAGCSLVCTFFAQSLHTLGLLFFLTGLFGAAVCQTSFVMLRKHCGNSFAAANAFTLFGTMLGGMTMPLITANLEEAYGLKGAILLLGALFMHFVPIGLVLKSPRVTHDKKMTALGRERNSNHDGDSETQNEAGCSEIEPAVIHDNTDIGREQNSNHDGVSETQNEAVCSKVELNIIKGLDLHVLWEEKMVTFFLMPTMFLMEIGYIGWTFFLVSYALSVGVGIQLAVYLPIAGAAAGLVTRTWCVILFHYKKNWIRGLLLVAVVVVMVGFFAYPFSSNYYYLLGWSVATGGGLFVLFPAYWALISDVVSEEHFPAIVSYVLFVSGLGTVSSGFVIGKIYDITNSFPTAFRILAGLMGVVLALILTYTWRGSSSKRKT